MIFYRAIKKTPAARSFHIFNKAKKFSAKTLLWVRLRPAARAGNTFTFLIPVVIAVAIASCKATVPALSTTTAVVAGTVFTGSCFRHADSAAFYQAIVQFADSFLCCLVIGHFNKAKPAGPAGEFVHDNFSRGYFSVLCKKTLSSLHRLR